MNMECIIQQNLIEKYNFWNFIHELPALFYQFNATLLNIYIYEELFSKTR